MLHKISAEDATVWEGEREETRSIEDDVVVLYSIFHGQSEFCEKQEGCLHVFAASPLL